MRLFDGAGYPSARCSCSRFEMLGAQRTRTASGSAHFMAQATRSKDWCGQQPAYDRLRGERSARAEAVALDPGLAFGQTSFIFVLRASVVSLSDP